MLVRGMTLHGGDAPAGDGAADDKVAGTVTSAAWSVELDAWVALGYLHRSVDGPGTGQGALGRRAGRFAPGAGRGAAARRDELNRHCAGPGPSTGSRRGT